MAGLLSKRHREEAEMEETNEGEELKRQKSYNQILSLLDEEEEQEEEPIEDLSSIITTLQQEISSPNQNQETVTHSVSTSSSSVTSPHSNCSKDEDEEEEEERERVMRHLLEASDDELGIPNGEFLVGDGVLDGVALCDALWELEDEAANYYTLFHSHLFM